MTKANEAKLTLLRAELAELRKQKPNKNTGFEIKEYEGRIKTLLAYPNAELVFTTQKYACYDAYTLNLTTGKPKSLIEIKDRNVTSTTYDTAQFECGKLAQMLQVAEETGATKLIFVAHYTDGKTASWNLMDYIHQTPTNFTTPYQTHGNNKMVTKQMILLPLSEAHIVLRKFTN